MSISPIQGRLRPWGAMALAASLLLATQGGCGLAFLAEEPLASDASFQGLGGRLVDFETGAAIPQAKVIIKGALGDSPRPYYVYSGTDGAFQIGQIARGDDIVPLSPGERYVLIVSNKAYRIKRYPATYTGGAQDLGLIECLPLRIGGEVLPVIPGIPGAPEEGASTTHLRVGPPVF